MSNQAPSSPSTPSVAPTQSASQTPTQGTATKAAPVANETPAQAQAAEVRKLKLKVDNQELELPESEVVALAQQGKAANTRFQEAAEKRKEAEAVIKFFKENPREAMKQLGHDVYQFSHDILMEHIDEQRMTPEQKAHKEMERKLREYEKAEKDAKEKTHAEEMRKAEETHQKQFEQTFIQALNESGLPKTPFTLKRMAELQLTCLKKGYELSPSDMAKIVREDYANEQKSIFGATDGDQLIALLGNDIVKKLSKAQVAKLKSQPQKYSKPVEKREQNKESAPKKRLNDVMNKYRL